MLGGLCPDPFVRERFFVGDLACGSVGDVPCGSAGCVPDLARRFPRLSFGSDRRSSDAASRSWTLSVRSGRKVSKIYKRSPLGDAIRLRPGVPAARDPPSRPAVAGPRRRSASPVRVGGPRRRSASPVRVAGPRRRSASRVGGRRRESGTRWSVRRRRGGRVLGVGVLGVGVWWSVGGVGWLDVAERPLAGTPGLRVPASGLSSCGACGGGWCGGQLFQCWATRSVACCSHWA